MQYDLHHRLYNNVLEGFTDEEANQGLSGFMEVSTVKYLAGHLLNSRNGLARFAEMEPEIKWNEMNNRIRDGLNELAAADPGKAPPSPFRVSESGGDHWAFINHHQAYHIGQIAI